MPSPDDSPEHPETPAARHQPYWPFGGAHAQAAEATPEVRRTALHRAGFHVWYAALTAVLVFAASRFAQVVTPFDSRFALIWLAPAVALVAVVRFGFPVLSGALVGAAGSYLAAGFVWPVALAAGIGDTIAAATSGLVLRLAAFDARLPRVRDVAVLMLGAGLGACFIPATMVVLALMLAGTASLEFAPTIWLRWWAAAAQGVLLAAPLLLTVSWRSRAERGLQLSLLAGAGFAAILVFVPWAIVTLSGSDVGHDIVPLAVFPVALWLASRLAPRDVAITNAAVGGAAIAAHVTGFVNFASTAPANMLVTLHGFIGFFAMSTMLFSAISAERRRVQQALAASEARFRSLTELSNDWYWEQDASLRFTHASPGFAVIGLEPQSILGNRLWDLPFDAPAQLWSAHRATVEARRPFRDLLLRRDLASGETRFFLTSGDPIVSTDGRFLGYRGVGREITAEKWAEEALRESEQRYASVFLNSPAAIMVMRVGEEGYFRFESCNPSVEALLERGAAALIGMRAEEALPGLVANAFLERFRRCMVTGTRLTEEVQLGLESGGKRIVMTLVPIRRAGLDRIERLIVIAIDVTEQHRAEQRMRESEMLFAQVFHASPHANSFSRWEDMRLTEVNTAWTILFGIPREAAVEHTALELGLIRDPAQLSEIRSRLLRGEQVRNFEIGLARRDGQSIEALYSGQLLNVAGQRVVVSAIVDVTDRKRGEEALRRSEESFSRMFQASPVPMVVTGYPDRRYVEVNDAWTRFFGFTRAEAIGRTAVELKIWPEAASTNEAWVEFERKHSIRNAEQRLRKKSGEFADVLVSAEFVELAGEPRVVTSILDITERKDAERQLRESERRFRDFAEAAGEYVWEVDADWRYTYLSNRIEAVLGYKPEELYGRKPSDLMPPGERERVAQWITEHAPGEQAFRNLEHRVLATSGTTVWQVVSGVPVRDAEGRVIGWRGTALDVTERKAAAQRIEELATRDPLTGLPNRLLLQDRMVQAIAAASRSGQLVATMFIDLDDFKRINDTLGHHVGDSLLKEVANRLSGAIRKGDTLSRLGGDEFVIVLEGLKSPVDAGQVAGKIIGAIATPFELDQHLVRTSCSIGVSLYPTDADGVQTLMRHADAAMYAAKEQGRRTYRFFSSEMHSRAVAREKAVSALSAALRSDDIEVFYQPRLSVDGQWLKGVSAYAQWKHPERGLLSQREWMELVEDAELMHAIGERLIDVAVMQATIWSRVSHRPLPMGIHVSARQFDLRLVDTLETALELHGLDGAHMEVYVDEATLMREGSDSVPIVGRLRELGVGVMVDGFGVGTSSIAHLRRLGLAGIRIHRALVGELVASEDHRAVVKAIVEMARSLNLVVVADGVESEEQLELVGALGCAEYSGDLHQPPMPTQEFERRLLGDSNIASLASRRQGRR